MRTKPISPPKIFRVFAISVAILAVALLAAAFALLASDVYDPKALQVGFTGKYGCTAGGYPCRVYTGINDYTYVFVNGYDGGYYCIHDGRLYLLDNAQDFRISDHLFIGNFSGDIMDGRHNWEGSFNADLQRTPTGFTFRLFPDGKRTVRIEKLSPGV